jgi:hypothetical protein
VTGVEPNLIKLTVIASVAKQSPRTGTTTR